MTFTNYLPDKDYLAEKLSYYHSRFHNKHPTQSHTQFMVVLAHKVASSAPQSYLRFGPYWWIVKAILIRNGYSYHGELQPAVASVYRVKKPDGSTDEDASLVAAFEFADMTNQTEFYYEREFDLYGTEERYVLMDEFMEFGIG